MPFAFLSPSLTLPSTHLTPTSSLRICKLHGRPLHTIPTHRPRPPLQHHTACTATKKGPNTLHNNQDEDEVLDETAMRAAEIHEVLQGLKDFRTRIIDDATRLAKKVRAPKKNLEAALASHPDIIKIDGHIADLEEELRVLGDR